MDDSNLLNTVEPDDLPAFSGRAAAVAKRLAPPDEAEDRLTASELAFLELLVTWVDLDVVEA